MTTPTASLLVQEQIASLNTWAASALADADGALTSLSNVDYPLVEIEGTEVEDFDPYDLTVPTMPTPMVIPTPPATESFSSPGAPAEPNINYPTVPSLAAVTIPSPPAYATETLSLPSAPSMPTLTLPNVPTVDVPAFDVAVPEPISLTQPTWTFPIEVDILVSDDPMVKAAMDRLKNNIENGGTGLSADVEDAIWNRDLERMTQQLEDSTDKVLSMWAKKGFSLPDGLLAHSLSELQKEYLNRSIDRSREIAIKQADLEQSNIFKSLELAVNLSFKLIQTLVQYADLVFRTQEATAKYFNEYLRLQIETHNSVIEVFKARIQQYEMSIRAGGLQVEIYKNQIEGQMALAGIGESKVKIYSAEIAAAIARYKGTLEGNQIIAQIFSAQVQGALAQSNVNESLVKAYAEQVRAEGSKAEIYKARVEAMLAEISAQKLKIEANANQITAWAKGVDAQIAVQNLNIEAIKSESQLNTQIADISNKAAEAKIRLRIAEEQLYLNNAQIQSTALTAKGNAIVEAARGVAQGAVSLAAGAMAAVSAHSSLGYSESMSLTET